MQPICRILYRRVEEARTATVANVSATSAAVVIGSNLANDDYDENGSKCSKSSSRKDKTQKKKKGDKSDDDDDDDEFMQDNTMNCS